MSTFLAYGCLVVAIVCGDARTSSCYALIGIGFAILANAP